jgi:hypothetical protein
MTATGDRASSVNPPVAVARGAISDPGSLAEGRATISVSSRDAGASVAAYVRNGAVNGDKASARRTSVNRCLDMRATNGCYRSPAARDKSAPRFTVQICARPAGMMSRVDHAIALCERRTCLKCVDLSPTGIALLPCSRSVPARDCPATMPNQAGARVRGVVRPATPRPPTVS